MAGRKKEQRDQRTGLHLIFRKSGEGEEGGGKEEIDICIAVRSPPSSVAVLPLPGFVLCSGVLLRIRKMGRLVCR